MAQTDMRSLHEIRQDTERTRAGLTETVEQLRDSVTYTAQDIRERITPAGIKAQVSGYVRSRGERLLDDIATSARQNPMQAAAIGVGIVYPLFRLARTIPIPVWMVGAGLYLAGAKQGEDITSNMAAEGSDEAVRRERAFGDAAENAQQALAGSLNRAGSTASSYAGDATNRVQGTLRSGSEQLRETADATRHSVSDTAAKLRDQTASAAEAAMDSMRDIGQSASAAGRRFTHMASKSAAGAVQSARETASDFGDRASRSFRDTVERNPLLVAGVGLLIGGLIASALPRTDFEDDMIGDTSNSVKRRARNAASDGFEAAKDAASEATRRATDRAEEEGLNPEDLREGVNEMGERVRRVAEAAVTTAFEPPEDNQPPHAHGERNHG